MINLDLDFFSWSKLWEVAGPFIIGAIATLVAAFIMLPIMATLKGTALELFRILALLIIVVVFFGSIYIAAGIWGYIS
jgi:preprotein translocase subunit SecF